MKKFISDLYRGYGYKELIAIRAKLENNRDSIGLNNAQKLHLKEVNKFIQAFEA